MIILDWGDIKNKCPQAFAKFCKFADAPEHTDFSEYYCRNLFDFFDDHGMYIYIEPVGCPIDPENKNGEYYTYGVAIRDLEGKDITPVNDAEGNKLKWHYNTRLEAELFAFSRSFHLLQAREGQPVEECFLSPASISGDDFEFRLDNNIGESFTLFNISEYIVKSRKNANYFKVTKIILRSIYPHQWETPFYLNGSRFIPSGYVKDSLTVEIDWKGELFFLNRKSEIHVLGNSFVTVTFLCH